MVCSIRQIIHHNSVVLSANKANRINIKLILNRSYGVLIMQLSALSSYQCSIFKRYDK